MSQTDHEPVAHPGAHAGGGPDDPHMGDAAKHPQRVERIIAVIFVVDDLLGLARGGLLAELERLDVRRGARAPACSSSGSA